MNRIRRAAPADSAALFDLTREFATSFDPQVEIFEQSFNVLVKQDDALLLVIDEAKQLLGYLLGFDHHTLYANGRVSWVEEIMVRPDRRRCGLGRDLMLQFEQWAATRGSRRRWPIVNAPFYTAIGYHESALYFRKLLDRPRDLIGSFFRAREPRQQKWDHPNSTGPRGSSTYRRSAHPGP
jgi:GNAT superfamily N-acetyltransferase